jgi:hypothetical protein
VKSKLRHKAGRELPDWKQLDSLTGQAVSERASLSLRSICDDFIGAVILLFEMRIPLL